MRLGSGEGPATIAAFLGVIALVLAASQPDLSDPAGGYLVSTIGLTAIAAGIRGLKLVRTGHSDAALASVLGVLGGVIATVVMITFLISFHLGAPSPATSGQAGMGGGGGLPMAQAPSSEASSVVVFPDAAAEQAAIGPVPGTIQFVLSQTYAARQLPDHLVIAGDGAVSTPDGIALAMIPVGAQLFYSVAPDRINYSVRVVGPSFRTIAEFDTSTGEVRVG